MPDPARPSPPAALALPVVLALAIALPATGADPPGDTADMERVYYDGLDERGRLTGGMILLPRPDLGGIAGGEVAPVATIRDNGPSSNRIDLVFVGDGYLGGQLGSYAAHVENALDDLFAQEPFATYQKLFNVHRVDVVSNESGVDNDPVPGVARDTALDMGFWCQGIERLLCVDVRSAYAYAANAPQVEHVFAVANSTKYGGAGYMSSDLATFAGGNAAAPEIAIHEIGHSLGNLADEYDYDDGAVYAGPERPEPNVSILSEAQMAASGAKWAGWLDLPGVGAFEGAYYHEFGINRPTGNSKMRSLGLPFNAPSIESFIVEFYRTVELIDASTPPGLVNGANGVWVETIDLVGHDLTMAWAVDGAVIPGVDGPYFDAGAAGLAPGLYTLSVTVRDDTPAVRDETARVLWMTSHRHWSMFVPAPPGCPADLTGDGVVDVDDLVAMILAWGRCAGSCQADLNGDGEVEIEDLASLVLAWGDC